MLAQPASAPRLLRRALPVLRSCLQPRALATAAQPAGPRSVPTESRVPLAVAQTPLDAAPTAAIVLVVNAGSRLEPSPGVAHVLKNALFKSTLKRSAIRLVREVELLGGVLSTALTREHLILSAEFLPGDEAFFAELLGDAITKAKFPAHEYAEEVVPQLAAEYQQAISDTPVYALDLAHQLAFRTGLGNSLFASPHTPVEHADAVRFARAAFAARGSFAVLASGVESRTLAPLIREFFVSPTASDAPAPAGGAKSKYYGGEVRMPSATHGASETVLVGFEAAARDAPSAPAYAVLRHLLGGESALKWGESTSALGALARRASGASAHAFNLAYADAGLFGVLTSARSGEDATRVAKGAVDALKALASGRGLSPEQVKSAIARAKFEIANATENRLVRLETAGAQLLSTGSVRSLANEFAKLDGVNVDAVVKAASAAIKSKPTTVAIGDTHKLPYPDTLGL